MSLKQNQGKFDSAMFTKIHKSLEVIFEISNHNESESKLMCHFSLPDLVAITTVLAGFGNVFCKQIHVVYMNSSQDLFILFIDLLEIIFDFCNHSESEEVSRYKMQNPFTSCC